MKYVILLVCTHRPFSIDITRRLADRTNIPMHLIVRYSLLSSACFHAPITCVDEYKRKERFAHLFILSQVRGVAAAFPSDYSCSILSSETVNVHLQTHC